MNVVTTLGSRRVTRENEGGRSRMARFRYRAVNARSSRRRRARPANEAEIVDRLRDQGLMPRRRGGAAVKAVTPRNGLARSRWFDSRPSLATGAGNTRELATLLAPIPLDRALGFCLLRADHAVRNYADGRDECRRHVAVAGDRQPARCFRLYLNIVLAGEAWLMGAVRRASPPRWSATRVARERQWRDLSTICRVGLHRWLCGWVLSYTFSDLRASRKALPCRPRS